MLDPSRFRSAFLDVPPEMRDAWLDAALGLGELPDDDPELPAGCVPYLPCPAGDLLHVVDHAPVLASDVFVDIGSGVGRATMFVHFMTGASTIGVEIQSPLVARARALTTRVGASRSTSLEGDAVELTGHIASGTIFFLYCPFGGDRLDKVIAELEPIARARTIRVCCVDMPLPRRGFLELEKSPRAGLDIYRSTLTA